MAKVTSLIRGWLTPASSPEQQMLAYGQKSNAALLKPLVERYSDDLYHFLLAQSDVTTAEDILQQTWLKVIEKRRSFNQGSSVKSWFFTIARNTLIDEMRRNQRWDFSDIDDCQPIKLDSEGVGNPLMSHLSTEQRVSEAQQIGVKDTSFKALLQMLPMAQREAIILQLEGFSIVDIANITSEKTETIKSRLRYAKQALKKHFETINKGHLEHHETVSVAAKEYQS